MTFDLGDLIALGALVASVWAIWKTDRFNRRQIAIERTAERLNQLLIEKEASQNIAQRQAELGVAFYKIGRSDRRLKVFNKGRSVARNVTFEELSEDPLLIESEIRRKFPAPALEPHGVIELIAAVHLNSSSRTHVRLTWDDDYGTGHTKEFHPTL